MKDIFEDFRFATKEDDNRTIQYYDEINSNDDKVYLQDEITTYNIHIDENHMEKLNLIAMTLAVQNYISSDINHINVIVSTLKEGSFRAYCYFDEDSEKAVFGILRCLAEIPDDLQQKMCDITLEYSEKDLNQQVLEFVKKSIA